MSRRWGMGVLHQSGTQRRFDVDGVVAIAFQNAVIVEDSARARSGFDGDSGALVSAGGGTSGAGGCVAAGGSEAGQVDGGGASLDRDSGHGWRTGCSGSCAALAGVGRDAGAGVRIGAASGAGIIPACARSFGLQTASRAVAFADAGSAAVAA